MSNLDKIEFEQLDVIIMSDRSPVSRLIHFFIGKWNHVAIAVNRNQIVHADCGRVMCESFEKLITRSGQPVEFIVLRFPEHIETKYVLAKLMERVGRKYDTRNAIGRMVYRIGSWFGVSRKSKSIFDNEDQDICTELLSGILSKIDIQVRPDVHFTQLEPVDYLAPDSIFDHKYSVKYDRRTDEITVGTDGI